MNNLMPKSKKKRAPAADAAPKKEKRSVAQQMVDVIRKEMGSEDAAMTLGGNGYSSVREVLPTRIEVLDQTARRNVVSLADLHECPARRTALPSNATPTDSAEQTVDIQTPHAPTSALVH